MTSTSTTPTTEEQSDDVVVHAINGDLHVIPQPQKHQTDKAPVYVTRLVPERGERQ